MDKLRGSITGGQLPKGAWSYRRSTQLQRQYAAPPTRTPSTLQFLRLALLLPVPLVLLNWLSIDLAHHLGGKRKAGALPSSGGRRDGESIIFLLLASESTRTVYYTRTRKRKEPR